MYNMYNTVYRKKYGYIFLIDIINYYNYYIIYKLKFIYLYKIRIIIFESFISYQIYNI